MSYTFDDILILIVSNSQEDRNILKNILSKYFKNIEEAEDGKIAYEIFKNNKDLDIIISDIDMVEFSGTSLLKLIRMSNLNIPFILTTDKLDTDVLLNAVEHNVSSFLLKPIDFSKLLEKVDLFCEQRIMEKKLVLKQEEISNYLKAVDKVSLIYKMHEDGNITYMNESMKNVSKYNDEDIKELNFKDIIHPSIPKNYIQETWNRVINNKLWQGNTKFIAKDKETFYLNNTIFKINNLLDDEYITISFLNTKENLKKRDFHKKVILNITESNKKEFEFKKTIKELKDELINCKAAIPSKNNNDENLNALQSKLLSKEKKIKLLESEILEFQEKYKKMLQNKKEELEHHINNAQKHKMITDKVKDEISKQTEEVDLAHKKIKTLLENIIQKDKTIKDLNFIIEEMEKKAGSSK